MRSATPAVPALASPAVVNPAYAGPRQLGPAGHVPGPIVPAPSHPGVAYPAVASAPSAAPQAYVTSPAEDDGVSMVDLLEKARVAFTYVKRYGWIAVVLGSLGGAAGVTHARMRPPAATAWCEVALLAEARANPMDKNATQDTFFVAAGQTFTSAPVIMATLKKLGWPTTSDVTQQVQDHLSFEQQGYKSELWRGQYVAANQAEAERFLDAHLQTYLNMELEKTLTVIQTETGFLREQLSEADVAVSDAAKALVAFREEHPHILAEGSENPTPVFTGPRQVDIAGIQQELNAARAQLSRGDVLLEDRVQAAREYESALADVNTKLAALSARGLGDQHPEVKQLKSQAQELRRLADGVVARAPTDVERRANPEYRKQEQLVQDLEQKLAVAQQQANVARVAQTQQVQQLASLPQLESEYARLDGSLNAAKALRDTLANKLKASQLQLSLERASAQAHYNIVSPPTAEPVSPTKTSIKRGGLGAIAGMMLAFAIAALLEFRRLAKRYRLA